MTQEELLMLRCIELAGNGLGHVAPNPLVGSVVEFNGEIVGEGFHQVYGGPHAEVHAIRDALHHLSDEQLRSATLYVNLEPCAHHGKTPPCADLIVKHKFKRAVIGCQDTFSEVQGKGIVRLQEAGIVVRVGCLENECRELNKQFFTFHEKKRPYVILKWAQTTSGFIAPPIKNRNPYWISSLLAKQRSHQWRSEEHAILIGANTLLHDNPKLNTRLWKGEAPIPIYIDRDLSVPTDKSLFGIHKKIYCVVDHKHAPSNLKRKNIHYLPIDFNKELSKQIALTLFEQKISSVIVEGGTKTLALFLGAGLWDEIRLFETKGNINEGIKAPSFNAILDSEEYLGNTLLKVYKKNHLKDAII